LLPICQKLIRYKQRKDQIYNIPEMQKIIHPALTKVELSVIM